MLLLVVLDVGKVNSLNSVAEIVSVNVGISAQLEWNRLSLSISKTKTFQIGLIIKLGLNLV